MDKLRSFLEKQNQIWLIIGGIALIGYGIYLFINIKGMENGGQEIRMKRILETVYNLGGKYTILAIFEFFGIAVLVSGILQFKNKL